MSESKEPMPVEQKTVRFYDDEVTAVLAEREGHQVVYVPIQPICDQWD